MTFPSGNHRYNVGVDQVDASGIEFVEEELEDIAEAVSEILWNPEGKEQIGELLTGVASTGFAEGRIRDVLTSDEVEVEAWRVGEAIAFAFLREHHDCDFPWPLRGDLKNPEGSPTGAEVVGFHDSGDGQRFAFGEVKTSSQKKWAPSVIFGEDGLTAQLQNLRDDGSVTDALVLYLGNRAIGSPWADTYKAAVARYLKSRREIAIFGVLVRDVEVREADLAGAASGLAAENAHPPLVVALHALYFPEDTIKDLGQPETPDESST